MYTIASVRGKFKRTKKVKKGSNLVQTVSEKIIQFGLNYYKKSKNGLSTGI